MTRLTAEELRYLDRLVRAALPINPSHDQWSPEERQRLSTKLLRMVKETL